MSERDRYSAYRKYEKLPPFSLKPCPFCGGEACMQDHVFVGYASTYGVVCLDCCWTMNRQYEDILVDGFGIELKFSDGSVFWYSASDGGYSSWEIERSEE